MLCLAAGNLVDRSPIHRPLRALPLRIGGILHVLRLTLLERLQRHAFERFRCSVVATRIHEALHLAVLDLLDDDVILRLGCGVALDLVGDDVLVGVVRARHDVLREEDGKDADDDAENDDGRSDAIEAHAARLHRRDLARTRQPAKRQERRQEHRHGKCIDGDGGQAKDEHLYDGAKRCAVFRNVLRDAKERAGADEYGRRAAYTEEEGEADLTEDVFVQKSYLHKDAPIT